MNIGQGRENARKFLKENPDLAEELKHKIFVKLGIIESDEPELDEEASEENESPELNFLDVE